VLVLTRRHHETITIGPDITITVLGISAGQVRLGITAPRDIAVGRDETRRRFTTDELADRARHIQDAISATHNTGERGRG
jgi:carbon storage regulator